MMVSILGVLCFPINLSVSKLIIYSVTYLIFLIFVSLYLYFLISFLPFRWDVFFYFRYIDSLFEQVGRKWYKRQYLIRPHLFGQSWCSEISHRQHEYQYGWFRIYCLLTTGIISSLFFLIIPTISWSTVPQLVCQIKDRHIFVYLSFVSLRQICKNEILLLSKHLGLTNNPRLGDIKSWWFHHWFGHDSCRTPPKWVLVKSSFLKPWGQTEFFLRDKCTIRK